MRLIIRTAIAAALAFAIAPAAAADLPARYPAPAPVYAASAPIFTWTGFYVGANAGYGFNQHTAQSLTAGAVVIPLGGFPDRTLDADGFTAGVTAGYNVQLGQVVLGVEGDINWADFNDSRALFGATVGAKTNWFGTARVRAGYAFDRFLPYVTGGALYVNSKANISGFGQSYSADSSEWGWVAGAGVEYAFTDHLSAKVEYLHGRVDGNAFTFVTPFGTGTLKADHRIDLVRAGLNYRF